MSFAIELPAALRGAFPDVERAMRRHLSWVGDYAAVGDREAALDALCDAGALCAELDCAGTSGRLAYPPA
jgi:hypothetical protein